MATTQSAISKKRKFVADGVFYAELNEFFQVREKHTRERANSIDNPPARTCRRRLLRRRSQSHTNSHRYQYVPPTLHRKKQKKSPSLTQNTTVIRATHTQEVLGEQGRRIRELTSLIQKRFKFPENSVSLYAAKVQNRGLSAVAQCESLRYKLLNGLAVRRACYGVLRFIMESGAKGCEVVVSGKLRAARAKSMKFTVRFPVSSGDEETIQGRVQDNIIC